MTAGRKLNSILANTFAIHPQAPPGMRGTNNYFQHRPPNPLARWLASLNSSASRPHSAMILFIVRGKVMMDAPFSTNAALRLVSWAAMRSVTPTVGYKRSTSEVIYERYFRLETWSYMMAVGRAEGNVVWISAQRSVWPYHRRNGGFVPCGEGSKFGRACWAPRPSLCRYPILESRRRCH